jgi:Fe-S-cluster-containing hydrogenase component 2
VLSKRKGMVSCVRHYKDAMLGLFYAIGNCCAGCCGAMQAHQHDTPILASSGFVAQVDAELCAACGSCADSCQFAAISVDDGFAHINASACMGCGVGASPCPQGAVDLIREPAKGRAAGDPEGRRPRCSSHRKIGAVCPPKIDSSASPGYNRIAFTSLLKIPHRGAHVAADPMVALLEDTSESAICQFLLATPGIESRLSAGASRHHCRSLGSERSRTRLGQSGSPRERRA